MYSPWLLILALLLLLMVWPTLCACLPSLFPALLLLLLLLLMPLLRRLLLLLLDVVCCLACPACADRQRRLLKIGLPQSIDLHVSQDVRELPNPAQDAAEYLDAWDRGT